MIINSMANNHLATLDPSIKAFIVISAFLGPLSILSLIIVLKKIERDKPDRIRWW